MAFADDLLSQARMLASKELRKPKQASLRRAVSTAYYAIFHLLVSEAVRHWSPVRQRAQLSRAFDHAAMKHAANRIPDRRQGLLKGMEGEAASRLRKVAKAFVRLQEQRHAADYNNEKFWTRSEAMEEVELAAEAFLNWSLIRNEGAAQDFLLSLLVRRRD